MNEYDCDLTRLRRDMEDSRRYSAQKNRPNWGRRFRRTGVAAGCGLLVLVMGLLGSLFAGDILVRLGAIEPDSYRAYAMALKPVFLVLILAMLVAAFLSIFVCAIILWRDTE